MTLTELANFCDRCDYSPAFCAGDPEICAAKHAKLVSGQKAEEAFREEADRGTE